MIPPPDAAAVCILSTILYEAMLMTMWVVEWLTFEGECDGEWIRRM